MTRTGEVVIGNKGSNYVSLKVIGSKPGGLWTGVEIEVHCDGWGGTAMGSFMKGELAQFAEEIRRLYRNLCGSAQLHPLEPNIVLSLTGDGKGHITVDGVARNDFASGTEFTFRFNIDQTYLEGIANSLSDADPK